MAEDARSEVLSLMNKKTKIEEEINQLGDILAQNRVGMNDPLVDNEGFPLAHVDIYQVRHARVRIICLQNDYKTIMKEIETGLSRYYDSDMSTSTENRNTDERNITKSTNLATPFAKITNVVENSPAYTAGLQNDDLLVEFGSINNENFNDITAIAGVVQHSQDTDLRVQIKRGSRCFNVRLRPRKWNGRGLLGCNITPLDFVDR